jgi:hypothetical protein
MPLLHAAAHPGLESLSKPIFLPFPALSPSLPEREEK